MNARVVYLDNNATTPISPTVIEAMRPYFTDFYYNPSSLYSSAKDSRYAIENARRDIAKFLDLQTESEIIFTGSASESNNAAIRGAIAANPHRKHIITTNVEHPAVLELCKELARSDYQITFLEVDENGELDPKLLINSLREDTLIVSIMHANNETGVIFPIEKLSKIVKMTDPEILFHTDATQTIGKIPVNINRDFPNVDLLSFSGHKIYAPKGIGILYLKAATRWRPFILGGHQERGRRAGTENVPYIVGLAAACMEADKYLSTNDRKMETWRNQLETFVKKNIPGIRINGEKASRLDSTSSISFQSIEGESLIYALNEYQICASTGSACSSGSLAPSHVLQAMKLPFSFAHGTVRFSFGRFNGKEDLDILCEVLPKIVTSLRQISPFWDKVKNCATGFDNT